MRRAMLLATLLGAGVARVAPGQELSIKRLFPTSADGCPSIVQPGPSGALQLEEADRVTVLAQEAAIVGNRGSARDLFRRAAQLDPRDEGIAYQLARAYEELGERAPALREFCRYLLLAPTAPDAGEVRTRIAALRRDVPAAGSNDAATAFRSGVEHFDRGRLAEAEAAFSVAIRREPAWAEAHYNRAVVLAARGDRTGLMRDLERYLEIAPGAPDRVAILDRMRAASRETIGMRPTAALAGGLVVPGLGQIYTRRPLAGLVVLGGVGGAVYYGVRPTTVARTRQFVDPFGQPYSETDRVRGRPHLAAGVAAASALTALAAAEAYLYARRARRISTPAPIAERRDSDVRPPQFRVVPLLLPVHDGVALGVRLQSR